MDKHLVISRHQEDITWIKKIDPSIKVFLYNKGSALPNHIPLPNTGRESHTYLHHILQHYNKLPDITIFVQGNPFDHTKDVIKLIHQEDLEQIRIFNNQREPTNLMNIPGYVGLGHYWCSDVTKEPALSDCRMPALTATWPELYDDRLPNILCCTWGAQFAVSRWRILSKPFSLYKHLYVNHTIHYHMPWAMELLWPYVFSKPLGRRKPKNILLL
jgi:hypothetical protein